ncbi:uncharacterized protein LOC125520762 [Triticum urartu]|uniref:uncharacterized protein LOC125520762 n=1 Tax=Triticum urartu TaxID=4572 RepID=UPI002043FFE3|nr:uncharacterized protein LOC125520762 [Triticum urartu]
MPSHAPAPPHGLPGPRSGPWKPNSTRSASLLLPQRSIQSRSRHLPPPRAPPRVCATLRQHRRRPPEISSPSSSPGGPPRPIPLPLLFSFSPRAPSHPDPSSAGPPDVSMPQATLAGACLYHSLPDLDELLWFGASPASSVFLHRRSSVGCRAILCIEQRLERTRVLTAHGPCPSSRPSNRSQQAALIRPASYAPWAAPAGPAVRHSCRPPSRPNRAEAHICQLPGARSSVLFRSCEDPFDYVCLSSSWTHSSSLRDLSCRCWRYPCR